VRYFDCPVAYMKCCRDCGAVVFWSETGTHDQFHEDLRKGVAHEDVPATDAGSASDDLWLLDDLGGGHPH
jgi:hypothetical protein